MNELKGELYDIEKAEAGETAASFDLTLNCGSRIFEGHFPGNPITPGVCLLQMAVELAEEALGRVCELSECKNIKYLQIIDPRKYPNIRYNMNFEHGEDSVVKVKLGIVSGDVTFTKMSLVMRLI